MVGEAAEDVNFNAMVNPPGRNMIDRGPAGLEKKTTCVYSEQPHVVITQ